MGCAVLLIVAGNPLGSPAPWAAEGVIGGGGGAAALAGCKVWASGGASAELGLYLHYAKARAVFLASALAGWCMAPHA